MHVLKFVYDICTCRQNKGRDRPNNDDKGYEKVETKKKDKEKKY